MHGKRRPDDCGDTAGEAPVGWINASWWGDWLMTARQLLGDQQEWSLDGDRREADQSEGTGQHRFPQLEGPRVAAGYDDDD